MDGAQPVNKDSSRDISSDTSNNNIHNGKINVKSEQTKKGVTTKSEVAPFAFENGSTKTMPQIREKDGMRIIGANKVIDENAVVEGIWDNSPNSAKDIVEKSQLESVENLSDDDIIRMAKEYLLSPEGQRDTRPYLRNRPSYAKNQIETVYESGKNEFGKVYDPSGIELPWDRSKPRNGQWDMGHIPGQKYLVIHSKYVIEMMTPEEFLQWYRDPRNYRPELPSTNRSHKYE